MAIWYLPLLKPSAKKLGVEWVAVDDDDGFSDEYDNEGYSGNPGGSRGRPRSSDRAHPGSSRSRRRKGGGKGSGRYDEEKINAPEDPLQMEERWNV